MKRLMSILVFLVSLSVLGQHNSSSEKILPNTVILKVKNDFRSFCADQAISQAGIVQVLANIKATSCVKEYPDVEAPERQYNAMGIKMADLTLIYRVQYDGAESPRKVAEKLLATGFFEYAEPFFLHDVLYTPSDPDVGLQYHLSTIKAYQAWDHAQGDPNIVIGITDTGVELTHPDLINAIKYNTADPIDGVDNDGDGYKDNYYGWDTGSNDNDPTFGAAPHGIVVSGLAAASTDNANQIAGTGFKSKFLPIRISDASENLVGSYKGIVYAVNHGCAIVNCSWGSVDSWSQQGQDVVTYAAINKDALVVCAAGNDNDAGVFYPASFEFALSVGGTDVNDNKFIVNSTFGSNYNEYVDICAPGRNIYSTHKSGLCQGGKAGTSFSAPITSGAAATVWSNFPGYSALQIGEILKATADSIDAVSGNETYAGLLGEGRLNMERCFTQTGFPGFYLYKFVFTGNNLGKMIVGDTVSISGTLLNFLAASSAATKVQLSSTSPFVKVINPTIVVGAVGSSSTLDLKTTPFKIVILPGMPASSIVNFVFTITDGTYNTKFIASATMNLDYVDIAVNKLATSVGASGKMGYNILQSQAQGIGITYNGSGSLLYQYGLMVADNSSQISYVLDGDFATESALKVNNPGVLSNFDVFTNYNDAPASNKLNISVKQKTLAWSDTKKENFILLEHTITNKSAVKYSNIHVGMYADWDINVYSGNIATFDATNNIAYTSDPGVQFAGIHLINNDPVHHYAFNNDGSNGSIGIYDNYTEAEQYQTLTNGNSRNSSVAGDCSQLLGAGPYTLAAGDSIKVVFAIVAGANLSAIQNAALESDSIYDALTGFDLALSNSTNPTCFAGCDGSLSITASNGKAPYQYLWDDPAAHTLSTASNLCAGNYTCTVTDANGNKEVISVSLSNPAKKVVNLGADTTLCAGASKTLNAGSGSVSYLWSTTATSQSITVNTAGSYSVIATDNKGCKGKDTIEVYVNGSPTVDLGSDVNQCSAGSINLNAANTGLSFLWSTGATSQSINVSTSNSYWVKVTNFAGCFDRDTVVVNLNPNPVVNLGADVGGCAEFKATLNAGNAGSTYLWSTGSTGQSISASINGSYYVKVTTAKGCVGQDTVNVNIENPPIVKLGKDTSICAGTSLVLNAGNPGRTYLWSTNETTQSITISKVGSYSVSVGTYCFAKDTIVISSLAAPLVSYKSGFNTLLNSKAGNVPLDFGLPKGGTYSGPGVSNNVFNTVSAGDGIHRVDYFYTGANGCVGSVWLNLDVNKTNAVTQFDLSTLVVSPNPFDEHILVRYSDVNLDFENINYVLYDAQGKTVKQGIILAQDKEVLFNIQTPELISGVYHLVLQNSRFKTNYKLVKL